MKLDELKKEQKVFKKKFLDDIRSLHLKYASDNSKFKVGDILICGNRIGRVESIMYNRFSESIYYIVRLLTKKLKEDKRSIKAQFYENDVKKYEN